MFPMYVSKFYSRSLFYFGKNKIKFQPTNVDEDFDELETDRFNDEYDRNSDGYLTGDELLFWVSLKF